MPDARPRGTTPLTAAERRTFAGDRRRAVALPLGGIGTGNLALGGTGVLKQWQLMGQGNHLGFSPQSFFALRLSCTEPPLSFRRMLRGPAIMPHPEPAPLVNDHLDAAGPYAGPVSWPDVTSTTFEGAYPFARLDYADDWPAQVRLEAYTPLVPLDAEASSLPLASFTFTITNRFSHHLHGWLLGTLQNLVGWDGVTPIRDSHCSILGGNVNRLMTGGDGTGLVLSHDDLDPGHPGFGSMALWTPRPAAALPQFDDADSALAFADSLKLVNVTVLDDWTAEASSRALAALRPALRGPDGPSPSGRTWAGALAVPFGVGPGQSVEVQFVYAWHFPNRRADFDRFGQPDQELIGAEPAWIGNHYATRFSGAQEVVEHFAERQAGLLERTRRWHDAVYDSSLPAVITDVIGAQPSLIRSPTTFRTADGRFYGFEGMLGESTLNWNGNIGGSCPLNCTHVWNYEQAVAQLFPSLERSMRETDWDVMQAPEGYLPHRVLLPADGPQLHGVTVGGPARPAIDGMLGTVLKTYREVLRGAGPEWLARYLPHAQRLMDFVTRTWDPAGSGVLVGDQPVTHDISLQGPNIFVGGLWLAALRAMQEMTGRSGGEAEAAQYGHRFRVASARYDELLWNGDYYSQKSEGQSFDFGDGCLADQLLGQWWAHQLNLGHILPADHVRTALASIVTFNYRDGFRGFEHGYRVFADADDAGLLICTWPRGGRPAVPIRYADEVWTGVEYQVAAHCLVEGMTDEGLRILTGLRARYDGTRRNPYNEIECGDHYSRAMAGFSVLDAWTGASYDAWGQHLRVGLGAERYPVIAGPGWGQVTTSGPAVSFHCLGGQLPVTEVSVPGGVIRAVHVGGELAAAAITADGQLARLAAPVSIPEGGTLTVTLAAGPR
ncbi:MAG TPA: GH116 family glycosyl-hydrolase [Trebonia sp.]|nr:GH116 family glycosyl-hydrolase [Trebonia sp.]